MRVTAKTGPYAGQTRVVLPEVDPMELLADMARHGWQWEVHYAEEADREEVLRWAQADLCVRVIRALDLGRVVRVMGREYRAKTKDDVARVAGEIEDEISNLPFNVRILTDDVNGVTISVREP